MIWRIPLFISVIYIFAYVDMVYGRGAAWAATSALSVIILPLSEIERRLKKQNALLAKILKGYI